MPLPAPLLLHTVLTFRQTQILPRVHLGPTKLFNFSFRLFLWRLIDQVFNLRSDMFWLVEMYAMEGSCNFDLVWGRECEGLPGFRMYTMTLNWWSFSNFSIGPFAPRNIYPDLTHQIGSENIWHLPESFRVKSVNLCTKYMLRFARILDTMEIMLCFSVQATSVYYLREGCLDWIQRKFVVYVTIQAKEKYGAAL